LKTGDGEKPSLLAETFWPVPFSHYNDDRRTLKIFNYLTFILSALLALVIALATVIYQSIKAATNQSRECS
jgi:hypothetical protein